MLRRQATWSLVRIELPHVYQTLLARVVKLPCEFVFGRIKTPVPKVCTTVSWSNTGPVIQEPCRLSTIINGISDLQAKHQLTAACKEGNSLAGRVRKLSTKLKCICRHARPFLDNGYRRLHVVCYKRRPTTYGVVSWQGVQDAPSSGSVNEKPLLLEAVGTWNSPYLHHSTCSSACGIRAVTRMKHSARRCRKRVMRRNHDCPV